MQKREQNRECVSRNHKDAKFSFSIHGPFTVFGEWLVSYINMCPILCHHHPTHTLYQGLVHKLVIISPPSLKRLGTAI